MRDLPGACEVDDPDEPARSRVVYRRAGTDPLAVVVTEVLEREHLHMPILGEPRTDAVGPCDRLTAPRSLAGIHPGGDFIQPVRAGQAEREPGRIAHLADDVGLLREHL